GGCTPPLVSQWMLSNISKGLRASQTHANT
ncbi:MAG: hypothetical protein RLZ51_697, partial [Pseudomonadota bacterium]